jgi:hypothetical protein
MKRKLHDNPRKNVEYVYQAWSKGKRVKPSESIWTDGIVIYSYNTWILARIRGGAVLLNATKYSVTTTQQQNGLRQLLRMDNVRFYESKPDVPRGARLDVDAMEVNPRGKRARKNPSIVTFGNPGGIMSRDVVEIRYKHAEDGKYYKHSFKPGTVQLFAADGSNRATLLRVDGKPLTSEY